MNEEETRGRIRESEALARGGEKKMKRTVRSDRGFSVKKGQVGKTTSEKRGHFSKDKGQDPNKYLHDYQEEM